MIIKYSDEFIKANPWIYKEISSSSFQSFVKYIVNSDYRKSVVLTEWLDEQIKNPSFELQRIAEQISYGENMDQAAINVLAWVKNNIVWVSDNDTWKMNEYWATAHDTATRWYVWNGNKLQFVGTGLQKPNEKAFRAGDCDDGAILIAVLCHLKGIPEDRIYIAAGDVEHPNGGIVGHAWAAYRPKNYPLNWIFLDWCYHDTLNDLNNRPMYYIKKNRINGYIFSTGYITKLDERYKTIWFIFNNQNSHYLINL